MGLFFHKEVFPTAVETETKNRSNPMKRELYAMVKMNEKPINGLDQVQSVRRLDSGPTQVRKFRGREPDM